MTKVRLNLFRSWLCAAVPVYSSESGVAHPSTESGSAAADPGSADSGNEPRVGEQRPVGRASATLEQVVRCPVRRPSSRTVKQSVWQSVDALPEAERAAWLQHHDPVHTERLTDESVFYRVTDPSWLAGQRLAGNPESCALISDHRFWGAHPLAGRVQDVPAGTRICRMMPAAKLSEPSLNVMCGPAALRAADLYRAPGQVLVRFTLGDCRQAGGGQVFRDQTSQCGFDEAQPVVVTLPWGQSVPVEIVAVDGLRR